MTRAHDIAPRTPRRSLSSISSSRPDAYEYGCTYAYSSPSFLECADIGTVDDHSPAPFPGNITRSSFSSPSGLGLDELELFRPLILPCSFSQASSSNTSASSSTLVNAESALRTFSTLNAASTLLDLAASPSPKHKPTNVTSFSFSPTQYPIPPSNSLGALTCSKWSPHLSPPPIPNPWSPYPPSVTLLSSQRQSDTVSQSHPQSLSQSTFMSSPSRPGVPHASLSPTPLSSPPRFGFSGWDIDLSSSPLRVPLSYSQSNESESRLRVPLGGGRCQEPRDHNHGERDHGPLCSDISSACGDSEDEEELSSSIHAIYNKYKDVPSEVGSHHDLLKNEDTHCLTDLPSAQVEDEMEDDYRDADAVSDGDMRDGVVDSSPNAQDHDILVARLLLPLDRPLSENRRRGCQPSAYPELCDGQAPLPKQLDASLEGVARIPTSHRNAQCLYNAPIPTAHELTNTSRASPVHPVPLPFCGPGRRSRDRGRVTRGRTSFSSGSENGGKGRNDAGPCLPRTKSSRHQLEQYPGPRSTRSSVRKDIKVQPHSGKADEQPHNQFHVAAHPPSTIVEPIRELLDVVIVSPGPGIDDGEFMIETAAQEAHKATELQESEASGSPPCTPSPRRSTSNAARKENGLAPKCRVLLTSLLENVRAAATSPTPVRGIDLLQCSSVQPHQDLHSAAAGPDFFRGELPRLIDSFASDSHGRIRSHSHSTPACRHRNLTFAHSTPTGPHNADVLRSPSPFASPLSDLSSLASTPARSPEQLVRPPFNAPILKRSRRTIVQERLMMPQRNIAQAEDCKAKVQRDVRSLCIRIPSVRVLSTRDAGVLVDAETLPEVEQGALLSDTRAYGHTPPRTRSQARWSRERILAVSSLKSIGISEPKGMKRGYQETAVASIDFPNENDVPRNAKRSCPSEKDESTEQRGGDQKKNEDDSDEDVGAAKQGINLIPERTLPSRIHRHPSYPRWYSRFAVPTPVMTKKVNLAGSFVGAVPNEPRTALDLYTPRFVKGRGTSKVGLCPICAEPRSRGGDGKNVWLSMKFSAYKCYHMQYVHGLATSGLPFSPPIAFRTVAHSSTSKHEKSCLEQGQCHKCKKWVNVEGVKDVEVKVPEIYWWKHAASCHQGSTIEGECDLYLEDKILLDVRAASTRYEPIMEDK